MAAGGEFVQVELQDEDSVAGGLEPEAEDHSSGSPQAGQDQEYQTLVEAADLQVPTGLVVPAE